MTRPLRSNSARGLTLIEVLVVISIISILILILIPAVQTAREAARQTTCRSNLRQIGLGLSMYEGAHRCLPRGRFKTYDPRYLGPDPPCGTTLFDKSFQVQILPYLDQSALYNSINQSASILANENTTVLSVVVSVYACPSDPGAGVAKDFAASNISSPVHPEPPGGVWRFAFTSYCGSFGSFDTPMLSWPGYCTIQPLQITQNNGAINDHPGVRLSQITDGFSQTMLAGEKANAWLAKHDDAKATIEKKSISLGWGWWAYGGWDTLFSAMYPPLADREGLTRAAASLHPGGLYVLMGDGSVRFIKNSIDSWPMDPLNDFPVGASKEGKYWVDLPKPGVWQKLATISGKESISSDAS